MWPGQCPWPGGGKGPGGTVGSSCIFSHVEEMRCAAAQLQAVPWCERRGPGPLGKVSAGLRRPAVLAWRVMGAGDRPSPVAPRREPGAVSPAQSPGGVGGARLLLPETRGGLGCAVAGAGWSASLRATVGWRIEPDGTDRRKQDSDEEPWASWRAPGAVPAVVAFQESDSGPTEGSRATGAQSHLQQWVLREEALAAPALAEL